MSYEKEIKNMNPEQWSTRALYSACVLQGEEADKEITNLKIEIEADDRNVNDLMDQLDSISKELESKDKQLADSIPKECNMNLVREIK